MPVRWGLLLAVLAVTALHGSMVSAKFGRDLLSTGNEIFIEFTGEAIVAQCGDMLVFNSLRAMLLKDGLCDPSAAMFAPVATEGELLQFLVPEKSVGRLIFADGDCSAGASLQEVNVICDVQFSDAVDAATEQSLGSYESTTTRGRALATVFEHEIDWGTTGPYAPIQAQCGESISFAWSGLEEHSLHYIPEESCPENWYSDNATTVMLHELATEGMYNMQLPLEGEFTMMFASSANDGLNCILGHQVSVFVSCAGSGNYTLDDIVLESLAIEEDLAPAPAPEEPAPEDPAPAPAPEPEPVPAPEPTPEPEPEPVVEAPAPAPAVYEDDDRDLEEDEDLELAPAPAPVAELLDERDIALDQLLGPAPGPTAELLFEGEEEYYDLEDMSPAEAPAPAEMEMELEREFKLSYDEEDMPPAPAPEEEEEEVVLRDTPRPKSEDEYDYDYVAAPEPGPEDILGPEYVYYYEELDLPGAAPGPAPVLKRIKRKSGQPIAAEDTREVPEASRHANYTTGDDNAASPAGRPVGVAAALAAGAAMLLVLLA